MTTWQQGYTGQYEATLWDRNFGVPVRIPAYGSVEKLAMLRDIMELAYQGFHLAETNFPVAMYKRLPLATADREERLCKNCIPCALRILGEVWGGGG